jgi:uncharacterized cysteine cluster protein YcgN (CxxCxxCC family)
MPDDQPFWKAKRLDEMTAGEWESLCDGCARCCLQKLPTPAGSPTVWSNVACPLLDIHGSRCSDYANRLSRTDGCFQLTPQNLADTAWALPPSCAYRLVAEGKDLAWWHPLVSGDPETVHRASISVRGRAVAPDKAGPEWLHRVDWPGRIPRGLRASDKRPTTQAVTPVADKAGDIPSAS